jgi:hypothetical protein
MGLRLSRCLAALLLTCIASAAAWAHPQSSFNLRVVHFERTPGGLTAYMRLSLPLVVGNRLGAARADGTFEPAPYTINRMESGQLFHYVDVGAVRGDASGLGRLIADGHLLRIDGGAVTPRLLAVHVHPKGHVPPFNTLDERERALTGAAWPDGADAVDAGYALVDAKLFYPHPGPIGSFELGSSLRAGLLGEPVTRNLLVDHHGARAIVYGPSGDLHAPITIDPSLLDSARTFFASGMRHILAGADHLLFVLCLVLAARGRWTLVSAITGFTVGHSLSLAAGFFGHAPDVQWFAPLIEVAIAASILFAALAALFASNAARLTFAVTVVIGVLHGFGFAIGLRELLGADGPNPLSSLLAFNLGVEAGQLAVAFAAIGVLVTAARVALHLDRWVRQGAAVSAALVACVWLAQRVPAVLVATSQS